MSISLYDASMPVFTKAFETMLNLLDIAETNAGERGIETKVLMQARLAPDMFPMVRQVQIATDIAKGAAARLSGVEIPSWPDEEASFDDLRDRLAKAIAFVKSVDKDAVNARGGQTVQLKIKGTSTDMVAEDYVLSFAVPNVYFHMTTMYAILRHNGVPLGKNDFLGRS